MKLFTLHCGDKLEAQHTMDEMYQHSLQIDLTYDFAQIINTEKMFALIYQISGEGGHHPSFYGYLGDCSQN